MRTCLFESKAQSTPHRGNNRFRFSFTQNTSIKVSGERKVGTALAKLLQRSSYCFHSLGASRHELVVLLGASGDKHASMRLVRTRLKALIDAHNVHEGADAVVHAHDCMK